MGKKEEGASQPKLQKISHFFCPQKDVSLGAVIGRLVALDGLSFSLFITSTELRKSLIARGFDLPKSRETIKKIFMDFVYKCKAETKREIRSVKSEENKLSLIFDEWTSSSNKRFINAIVKTDKKSWNTGLIRLKKSGTAEVCLELVTKRLEDFDLSLTDDIVAFTTDGAATMKKIGKLIAPKQQLCLAHGVHLALIDVFYKPLQIFTIIDEEEASSDDEDDLESFNISTSGIPMEITNTFGIKPVIEKIRTIVKSFRKSPTKNEILQKYVKDDRGCELKLILDCKTRWNTLLAMCKRFSDLELPIRKALIDLKVSPFTDEDFIILKQIVTVLDPIKATVEALCRGDMNLCKADAALCFMLKELSSMNCNLSKEIHKSLSKRIQERRTVYSTLLNFLTNPSMMSEFDKTRNMYVIKMEIISLVTRLKKNANLGDASDIEFSDEDLNVSIEKKLNEAINKCTSPKKSADPSDVEYHLSKEIEMFTTGGVRGRNLQTAYKYLLTIPPTSVECERCFSSSSYINNKIRSRLSDETLDAIIFLRSYLKQ